MNHTIQLSPEAEARVVFWTAPDSALHPAAIVAAVLDLEPATLTNMRTRGDGPSYSKRGGKIYYRGSDVRAWMSNR